MMRHEEPEKENNERWLLTYSDLITLLLAFFIIMYAMSSVDQAKFAAVSGSLKVALGSGSAAQVVSVLPGNDGNSFLPLYSAEEQEKQKMTEVQEQVTSMVEKANLQNDVSVSMQERGLVISINSYILFESGSATVTHDSVGLLEKLSAILTTLADKQIRIEGHTDTDPINTREFPSNWELSSARATNVLRLLLDKANLNPTKLSAVGYGEYRPKEPNTTAANKAQNRRVDIVIIKDSYDKVDPSVSPIAASSIH